MNFKSELHKIKAFLFDVDGVMTDGKVLVTADGDLWRTFNAKDGYAIRFAVSQGYKIGIITGGASDTIALRFRRLGVDDIYLCSYDKTADYDDFKKRYGLIDEEIIFMGDDVPDIPVMQACGIPVCPADAVDEVKRISRYISPYGGGSGCVRDVVEQVMKIQGNWRIDSEIPSG